MTSTPIKINGWTIHHDGFTWWTTRENDEAHASISYLEAQAWALANPK
jgi:hypothetical protein